MRPKVEPPRVVVVVPTYAPRPEVVERLRLVRGHAPVVVVDDGTPSNVSSILDGIDAVVDLLVRLPDNVGIAAALNCGWDAALNVLGADLVLTLDQDSSPPPGYVALATARLLADERSGLVYPEFVDGVRQVGRGIGNAWRAREPIQSGWLMSRAAWGAVGRFDESLVIDGVDTDYFLRALDAGWRPLPVLGADLAHELGEEQAAIAGLTFRHHAPARRYYITRNRLRLAARHGRRHPRWALRSTLSLIAGVAKAMAFAPRRLAVLRACGRGAVDACVGISGIDRRSATRHGRSR